MCVAKPSGLLTQGVVGGELTLEDEVRGHLSRGEPGRSVYLATVHRLDRPVSGVVLWAKTPKAARRLADQFAQRVVKKTYWSLVESHVPTTSWARWDDWLSPVGSDGVARCVGSGLPDTKQAITEAQVIRTCRGLPEKTLLVILAPQTGRTHQLRAQAASHIGPILGDVAYGSTLAWAHGEIALHARQLEVEHPILRTPLVVIAPLPERWPAIDF